MAQIAVIGLGRFGSHAARELAAAGHDVLAIDIEQANVQALRDQVPRAICLDARERERLEALGLGEFDAVVVSLGERVDASALITLHLRDLGVPRIVTKAGSEDHGRLLALIGAHQVVFPEKEAAARLARQLGREAERVRQERD